MRAAASQFEFKYRFWIIGAIFGFAFLSYSLDHQNAGAAVAEWLARMCGTVATNGSYRAVFSLAASLCVLAAWIRTWATAYLQSEVMMASQVQTARLVADGPYRYVRNPLYCGNILLALGFGVMASRLGFFILVIGMWIFVFRLILREEAGIAASQGQSYLAYRAAVPRLWPAIRAQVPSGRGVPDWRDGLLGEAFMWVIASSVIAFAITLNQVVYFCVLGAAFVVYGFSAAMIQKRNKRSAGVVEASPKPVPPEA